MRKRLCVCLALLLCAALTLPASASNPQRTTIIEASSNLPEIRVTVPSTASVLINPYKIPVEVHGGETGDQIISTPSAIENQSEMPLSVDVAVTAVIREGSDMRLVSERTKGQGMTSKSAFVYFEIVASDSTEGTWAEKYSESKHILVRAGTRSKNNMVTLDPVDGVNRFGAFHLTGDCVAYPKIPWTEEDGIDVEITFTFRPLARDGVWS